MRGASDTRLVYITTKIQNHFSEILASRRIGILPDLLQIYRDKRAYMLRDHGKVIGNVTVTDRVELKSTAELVGDIQAASLAIEGGAIFIGHSPVGAPTGGATGISAAKKAASVQAFAPEPESPAPASQSTLDIDAE